MSWLDEVKRFNKPYYKWTLETRKKFLDTELRAERKLALEIEEAAEDLTRYMKKLPKDHAAQMKYVQEGLREFAKELRGVQKQTLTDGIEKAAAIGVEYSRRMTRDVFGPVLPLVEKELENVFGAVQDDVIKAMWNRRLAGLQLSDRIWKISKSNADAIGRIVLSGIAENMDIVDIANALEEYVQEGARTIAKDYPNMMKRMGKRLPANLNYEALRLVRTEVSAAHGDALIRSAAYNPACKGVKWVLSSEHPEYDICDELANANIGYGAGVYPVDQAPPMPAHPNCLCFFIEVVEEPEQFVEKLKRWAENPESEPELEQWYQNIHKPGAGKAKLPKASQEAEEEEDIINLDDFEDLYEKYRPNDYGLISAIEDVEKHSHLLVHEATPEEQQVVKYYTSSEGYKQFNRALRFPEIGKTVKGEIKKGIETLTNLIKKASPLSQNTIFYRHDKLETLEHLVGPEVREIARDIVVNGDTSKMPELKKLLIRSVIQDKGFLSTSYRRDIFVYENGLEIRIHAPKGFKGGLFLEEISEFQREREYLFAPGQKFRVLDVEVGEVYQGMKNLILHVVPVE